VAVTAPLHADSGAHRAHDDRAKITQIDEGTNQVQRMVIAQSLLK
jgi:alkylation response protein AidB-like acyl-CoA dehydrogenase